MNPKSEEKMAEHLVIMSMWNGFNVRVGEPRNTDNISLSQNQYILSVF